MSSFGIPPVPPVYKPVVAPKKKGRSPRGKEGTRVPFTDVYQNELARQQSYADGRLATPEKTQSMGEDGLNF